MKSANEIINDPIKATLFGKFYEKIVLGWLKEKKGFIPFDGKPIVYWEGMKFTKDDSELSRKLKETLDRFKKDRKYCIPDGLLEKGKKYYLWEAKNWPLWSEGKKPIDQLRDLISSLPQVLAETANHKSKPYPINGFLFSWWSKPEGVDELVEEINQLIHPRSFEIFYTSEVLDDCIEQKYPWYIEIIKEEKKRIDELFRDLLGIELLDSGEQMAWLRLTAEQFLAGYSEADAIYDKLR